MGTIMLMVSPKQGEASKPKGASSVNDFFFVKVEDVALELVGGPVPGRSMISAPWPLPDTIEVEGMAGVYIKVSESQLPAGLPHIVRGATFRWHSDTLN